MRREFTEDEIEALAAADEILPPSTEEELAAAVAIGSGGRAKVPISIRLDESALAAFRSEGPRYQTRINDVLVAYASGQMVGPISPDVLAFFGPDRRVAAQRITAALRQHIRREQGKRDHRDWSSGAA